MKATRANIQKAERNRNAEESFGKIRATIIAKAKARAIALI
jgi:hypothetical protein